MKRDSVKIMLVAGEASGDAHAAKLARALIDALPEADVELFGCAGPKMRSSGVEAIVAADELSVIGLPEIARALPMFLSAFRKLKTAARERRPDVAVLIDFPDFNMKLARSLKKQGLTVVYYISPQLWAWRKYRLRTIRKYVDLVLAILPFEKDWYAGHGVEHVEYVGNPLAREVAPASTREEFCERHGLDPARPLVALLPGSRRKEITKILPDMLNAASLLAEEKPAVQFAAALAAERHRELFAEIAASGAPKGIAAVVGETYDALNAADAAAVTSGTATLETGIIGVPMAIVYKTSEVNYGLLRPLINVEHFGLINLIAGERIAKELIQGEFTPETLAAELARLLEPDTNADVRSRLKAAADKLGHGGASKRAAEAIIGLMNSRGPS